MSDSEVVQDYKKLHKKTSTGKVSVDCVNTSHFYIKGGNILMTSFLISRAVVKAKCSLRNPVCCFLLVTSEKHQKLRRTENGL